MGALRTTARATALMLAMASPARPGCGHHRSSPPAPEVDAPAPRLSAAPSARVAATPVKPPDGKTAPLHEAPALQREGASLALSREGDRLYAATEELRAIGVVLLRDATHDSIRGFPVRMPGAPANVLVLADGRVLATIRDPGLLLVLRRDEAAGLVETARVEVAPDAWGLALSPDGATAYVTSAWTHTVTAVDLASHAVRWKLDVPREPRGIVAHPRGPIYVSHLTSAEITRIDVVDGAPRAHAVSLPPSPLRTPRKGDVDASLGYALALSPDALRLYAPRHALGVVGEPAWFGAATVDVLLVPHDEPLAPRRAGSLVETHVPPTDGGFPATYPSDPSIDPKTGPIPTSEAIPFSQPRAVVYRRSTDTLLVAGEGDRWITELDALAADPAMHSLGSHGYFAEDPCFAPSGVVLTGDEQVAYVYCRATFDVRAVSLDDAGGWVHGLGVDPADKDTAMGRRNFYNARRNLLAEGVACSGCHPEGRDDGHVWHEVERGAIPTAGGRIPRAPDGGPITTTIFTGGAGVIDVGGRPRQTPMLAGRLRSPGPYGWLGESADVAGRIRVGARLHGWFGGGNLAGKEGALMVKQLAAFVRNGLVPPPRETRPLSEVEQRGKAIFERKDVACASCHGADDDAPNLVVKLAKLPAREWFDDEDVALKVPSLRFVGGTPPYLHDGSAATLPELLEKNGDRMGHTAQLTADERAALAAYLGTL